MKIEFQENEFVMAVFCGKYDIANIFLNQGLIFSDYTSHLQPTELPLPVAMGPGETTSPMLAEGHDEGVMRSISNLEDCEIASLNWIYNHKEFNMVHNHSLG